MYERIYIDNYKCLVNFDLHLSETSLLVGSNGSGKTAVLDVVFGLRRLLAGEAKVNDRVAFHPSTLTRWQSGREQLFEIEVSALRRKVPLPPQGRTHIRRAAVARGRGEPGIAW